MSNLSSNVHCVAVKPDTENQILSSSSMDGCIRTFDLTSQTLVSTIVADPGQVLLKKKKSPLSLSLFPPPYLLLFVLFCIFQNVLSS